MGRARTGRSRRSGCVVAAASIASIAATLGCSGPLTLSGPSIAPAAARSPSPVDVDPIAAGAAITGDFTPPGPAAVLTAAMNAELRGRALHGGDAGGYTARCTLDRFAVRSHASVTESRELLTLYADLSCDVSRSADHAPVWRGELRARVFSVEPNVLGSDVSARPRMLDRALSDAAREIASDLAVRALGLLAEPSARVFTDGAQQRARAGLDDSPFGPAALQETAAASEAVRQGMGDASPGVRAAAWNAAAMAAGPGDDWMFGAALALDDDVGVRFEQYKALARIGSPRALAQLRSAARGEGEPLLAELLADAIGSGGTGLARSHPLAAPPSEK